MTKLKYLFKIIYLLQSGNILTAKTIGERLDISARNARAYLNELMNANVPIMSINGCRGGYFLSADYFLKVPAFTEAEMIDLGILKTMIDNPHQSQFTADMASAIAKILLAEKKCKEDIKIEHINATSNPLSEQVLKLVHLAIRKKQKVQINYQSLQPGAEVTKRIICPYEIRFKDMAWYAYAFCELRKERRLFNLNRVREVDLLADHFHIEDDDAFDHDMGKAFALFRGETEYKVKIRFEHPASQWVRECIWIKNQQIIEVENQAIIYSCTVDGLETIERWVLRYGDLAKVVEPEELKERIRGTLGRMVGLY